jgi:hypothetical protein
MRRCHSLGRQCGALGGARLKGREGEMRGGGEKEERETK